MKNWILRNWFTIAVILLLVVLLRIKGTNNRDYKHEIDVLSDSIARLDIDYNLLETRLQALRELTTEAINESNLYADSLRELKRTNKNLKYRYAQEVADLKRIPTDTLYLDVTGWLDTLSFD